METAYATPLKVGGARALSLRLNFAWTSAGTLIYAALQWATLSLLAKLGSPAIVGQYAQGIAIATPVLMLAHLNLRAVIATDVRNQNPFLDYLSLRLLTTAAGLGIIAFITLAGGYRAELAWIILAVSAGQAIDGASDICYGWLQRRERMERIAISLIARGILATLAIGIGFALTGSLLLGVGVSLLARLAVLLGFDLRQVPGNPAWRFGPSLRRQMRVLWIALPLGIVLMFNSLDANVPRYWIEHHQGERMLGIFSAIASLMTVGGTVVNALGQAATPRLAKLFSDGDRRAFRGLLARLLALGLGIGLAGIAVAAIGGRFILTLVYRPEYALHAGLLVAMMAAGAIGYLGSLLGYAITATRAFRVQAPLYGVVAASAAAGSFWLIPRYGLLGGAFAIGIAALVQVLGEIAILWRAMKPEAA